MSLMDNELNNELNVIENPGLDRMEGSINPFLREVVFDDRISDDRAKEIHDMALKNVDTLMKDDSLGLSSARNLVSITNSTFISCCMCLNPEELKLYPDVQDKLSESLAARLISGELSLDIGLGSQSRGELEGPRLKEFKKHAVQDNFASFDDEDWGDLIETIQNPLLDDEMTKLFGAEVVDKARDYVEKGMNDLRSSDRKSAEVASEMSIMFLDSIYRINTSVLEPSKDLSPTVIDTAKRDFDVSIEGKVDSILNDLRDIFPKIDERKQTLFKDYLIRKISEANLYYKLLAPKNALEKPSQEEVLEKLQEIQFEARKNRDSSERLGENDLLEVQNKIDEITSLSFLAKNILENAQEIRDSYSQLERDLVKKVDRDPQDTESISKLTILKEDLNKVRNMCEYISLSGELTDSERQLAQLTSSSIESSEKLIDEYISPDFQNQEPIFS